MVFIYIVFDIILYLTAHQIYVNKYIRIRIHIHIRAVTKEVEKFTLFFFSMHVHILYKNQKIYKCIKVHKSCKFIIIMLHIIHSYCT